MAGSLRDQLLKAGLVNEKQVKEAKRSRHEQRKKGAKEGAGAKGGREAQQAQAKKAERDRELNRRRTEEAERKALAAQVRQMVEANRITGTEGEVPYNFTEGGKIKRLYVSGEIHERLVAGRIAIIRLGGRHELVSAEVAEKIRERSPAAAITLATPEPESAAADDPYADYQVPDDLIW